MVRYQPVACHDIDLLGGAGNDLAIVPHVVMGCIEAQESVSNSYNTWLTYDR